MCHLLAMPKSKTLSLAALSLCTIFFENLMLASGHALIYCRGVLLPLLNLSYRLCFWMHSPNVLVVITAQQWLFAAGPVNAKSLLVTDR
jgi:hypothetical protein